MMITLIDLIVDYDRCTICKEYELKYHLDMEGCCRRCIQVIDIDNVQSFTSQ